MSVEYDHEAAREYTVVREGCKYPSSTWWDIRCPFCQTISRAYRWSLYGGGKLCEAKSCRAKHNGYGTTIPRKEKR